MVGGPSCGLTLLILGGITLVVWWNDVPGVPPGLPRALRRTLVARASPERESGRASGRPLEEAAGLLEVAVSLELRSQGLERSTGRGRVAADRDQLDQDLSSLSPPARLRGVAPGIRMAELASLDLFSQAFRMLAEAGSGRGGVLAVPARRLASGVRPPSPWGRASSGPSSPSQAWPRGAERAWTVGSLPSSSRRAFLSSSPRSRCPPRVLRWGGGSVAAFPVPGLRVGQPDQRPHQMIQRKHLEGEWREPEIAG